VAPIGGCATDKLDHSRLVAKGRPTRALGVPVGRINTTPLLGSWFASFTMEFIRDLAIVLLTCSFVDAQWLDIPAKGMPRWKLT
jgi:hypothetical protein